MEYKKTAQNKVKRGNKKASYDQEIIYAILDDNEICSVAFTVDNKASVQPINYGRKDNKLYIHGSSKNRMTSALAQSGEVCLSVFTLDSMKLTRSAFNHSVNFHSVVVFGSVVDIQDNTAKLNGLEVIINHFVPNRWEHCRAPNIQELKATKVLEITIESASAKIAKNPPEDKQEDLELDFWSGSIPVNTIYGQPIANSVSPSRAPIPKHIIDFCDHKNSKKSNTIYKK